MSIAYVDTSALVKLAVLEAESPALVAWLSAPDSPAIFASSILSSVELARATRRHSAAAATSAAAVLARTDLVSMTPEILAEAAVLDPAGLRTLDAIHLATALRLGGTLTAFVAYDSRLLDAASAAGLPVRSPS